MTVPLSKINLTDLCRLCLEKGRTLIPLFKLYGSSQDVVNKISTCLSIKVTESDELPQSICRECLAKVEFTYEFWNKARQSQKQLEEWALRNKKIEEELKNKSAYIIIHPIQYLIELKLGPQYQVGTASNGSPVECISTPKKDIDSKSEEAQEDTDGCSSEVLAFEPECKLEVGEQGEGEGECDGEGKEVIKVETKELGDNGEGSSELSGTASAFDNEEENSNKVCPEPTTFVAVEGGGSDDLCFLPETEKETSKLYSLLTSPMVKLPLKQQSREKKADFPCSTCGKLCRSSGALEIHHRKHTGERPFVCQICGKGFYSAKSLTNHGISHSNERPFACDKCEATFKRKTDLNVHDEIHKEGREFECEMCGFTCLRRANMLEHKRRHLGDFSAYCPVCNKGFLYPSHLKEHMVMHSQERPHVCQICCFAFTKKSNLFHHTRRMHGSSKPQIVLETLICEFCSKKLNPKAMRRHLRCHSDVTDRFPCTYCGKLFADKGYLKIHTRIHTGERPYICDLCGKGFLSKNHIKVHMVVHTKEKPHVCDLCGKKYSQRGTLTAHKKMAHVPCTNKIKGERIDS